MLNKTKLENAGKQLGACSIVALIVAIPLLCGLSWGFGWGTMLSCLLTTATMVEFALLMGDAIIDRL